ncbi:MAG: uracil-DNA glycosylase [Acholeplasmataceae bacterium]|nr:uracil-DNA glycosylase [Acholeplasmataceae bacterium]
MNWDELLKSEKEKSYFYDLENIIKTKRLTETVYPPASEVYNALELTPYDNVKVVIIGQDPYHGFGQAHGLAFSVKEDSKMPPSLKNIFLELYSDLRIRRTNTNLTDWAQEGVLLLNTILTVEEGKPLSHQKLGWETFTNKIIELVNNKKTPVVFILWGNNAISFKELITNPIHLVITSSHPSPLSARHSFFGSKPFSRTNEFLISNNIKPINW